MGGGFAPGADGGQHCVRGQQRGGGGGNSGGVSTSKNRPSHHKYKSPTQFELKQS